MSEEASLTMADALQQWRTAERSAAVARRGRVAAEVAAAAAEAAEVAAAAAEAAEAAVATAEAAKSALDAMALAEKSAAKTATGGQGRGVVFSGGCQRRRNGDRDADIDEAAAKQRYREAVDRATERS